MVPQKVIELVRSTGDIAFAVDDEGKIVAWNAAAEAAFDLSEREAIATKCAAVLSGIDECGPVCSRDCTVRQSSRERHPVKNFDLQVLTPNGRRWYNISVLVYTETGSPETYALHIARSVDVRKRLEVLLHDFVRDASSPELVDTNEHGNRLATRNAPLTSREINVLELLARGLATEEIARELSISRTTVNNHVQHAMKKLDAHSRLEAIRKATFAGFI
jgi:DNA-binding CsgD family transcriptional regulator